MDDLNGLDWAAPTSKVQQPAKSTGNYYPTLQPTPSPLSTGRATPVSVQSSGLSKNNTISGSKQAVPDSFANLVSFGSAKQSNSTLQEQQAKLEAEKARKLEEQKRQYSAQFGNTQFWDGLGNKSRGIPSSFGNSRSSTPALLPNSGRASPFASKTPVTTSSEPDDDLFAAFNKDTKVDNSSHYPPPSIPTSGKNTPASSQETRLDLNDPQAWQKAPAHNQTAVLADDDDDPFGLNQLASRNTVPAQAQQIVEEDDFLGDLGKPVDQVKKLVVADPTTRQETPEPDNGRASSDPWDQAVVELIDMGFSAEQSRRALTESGAGINIQAAVSWLLNDAHRLAKEKTQSRTSSVRPNDSASNSRSDISRREEVRDESSADTVPAWMRREGRDASRGRREDSQSPANSDVDISKIAAAAGSNLLKTANSLWKTSQKKVQKAVSEFQQEADPGQPKWMRQPIEREVRPSKLPTSATDEAIMLEGGGKHPPRSARHLQSTHPTTASDSLHTQSPTLSTTSTGRVTPNPRWQQSAPAADARSRLSKQAVEEASAQAYISPARRKKNTNITREEPDLLFSDSGSATRQAREPPKSPPVPAIQKQARPVSSPVVITPKPKVVLRNIPAISPSALQASTRHRLQGTEHFKRGDYASAHVSYSSSLSALPQGHPITIVLLCNRSLTALKTGEPKTAVADADNALQIIGPGRGDDERIDLQIDGTDSNKPMKEYWGKALTRKAEALEQMERWAEARDVWKEAVEAGTGGPAAAQGRQRCEKALLPKAKPAVRAAVQKAPTRTRATGANILSQSGENSEAVARMRAANIAAEKADDEKFALSDSVDARVKNWREGRKDNLRALLGGLDTVLWDESGWKKIGMHELVMNGKVKINYMKAIAKVHPDKVSALVLDSYQERPS